VVSRDAEYRHLDARLDPMTIDEQLVARGQTIDGRRRDD